MKNIRLFKIVFFLFLFVLVGSNVYAYDENIPKNLKLSKDSKVYGTTVPSTFALYSFHPDLIAGWNTPLYDYEKKYIQKKYLNLPVLGGWYGNGIFPNKEVLLGTKFDAALALSVLPSLEKKMEDYMTSIKVPLVMISSKTLEDDIKMYETLGKIFNMKERAIEINSYIKNAINNLDNINKQIKTKKKVYYADGENGLDARCIKSIEIAGGLNVHKCVGSGNKITFEQLMIYNPDIIISDNENFYNSLKNNKKWQRLRAVKNNKVYLIPYEPFSWIKKKTIMEYYVVQHLAALFYPEYSKIDLVKELTDHLKVFLNYNISEKDALKLIKYTGSKNTK